MELRPGLTPPALDPVLVARLSRLAADLDHAHAGQFDDELAEFNRLAGTSLAHHDFCGIYGAEEYERWVRRELYRRRLTPDPELTVAEMTEVVSRVMACGADHDFYLVLFTVNCNHASVTDLIYWPDAVAELPQGREPTAKEIAELALRSPT